MPDERPEEKREEGQGRKSGRHRGFRGRHLGRASGLPGTPGADQPARASPGARENGRQLSRDSQGLRPRGARSEETSRQDARDMPACPLCGKPVYDLSTAIAASREAADPAHFDCVLERVNASESISPGEKLVYLGSGSFGVVEIQGQERGRLFREATHSVGERGREEGLAKRHLLENIESLANNCFIIQNAYCLQFAFFI